MRGVPVTGLCVIEFTEPRDWAPLAPQRHGGVDSHAGAKGAAASAQAPPPTSQWQRPGARVLSQ